MTARVRQANAQTCERSGDIDVLQSQMATAGKRDDEHRETVQKLFTRMEGIERETFSFRETIAVRLGNLDTTVVAGFSELKGMIEVDRAKMLSATRGTSIKWSGLVTGLIVLIAGLVEWLSR